MSATHYIVACLAICFLVLALDLTARLVGVILRLVGDALHRVGLRYRSGKPRNPRWAVQGVYVNKVRRPGFVATCPWWVVAVWIEAKAKGGAG